MAELNIVVLPAADRADVIGARRLGEDDEAACGTGERHESSVALSTPAAPPLATSAGPPERRSVVPLIPKKWLGQILVAVIVAAAEVVLSESVKSKKSR
jgi:hypothetical protein